MNKYQGEHQRMTAIQPLSELFKIKTHTFSKKEKLLLEALLLSKICEEIKESFRSQYKDYFRLMKFTKEMENTMLEENLLQFIVNDLVLTQNYTPEGIAFYTATHEDVINDIISGQNTNPSEKILRRVIGLHKTVRRDYYQDILNKLIELSSSE